MTKPLMLICDDDPGRAARWVSTVQGMPGAQRFEVRSVSGSDLANAVEALNIRREAAREDHPEEHHSEQIDSASSFDQASLVLVDYDLTPDTATLNEIGSHSVLERLRNRSGESVAYLARCYSRAGFLVVVNQRFRERTFDVTMQRFADSYADLNISQADLNNPALWLGSNTTEGHFHPWSWPVLSEADRLSTRRLEATDLDAAVLDSLGLANERFNAKQLDLLGELNVNAQQPEEVTFDMLVESSLGLDAKDQQPSRDKRRVIAASVVSRWLDQLVLPSQNVIADLPHLVARFPQLLGDAVADPKAWTRAATKTERIDDLPQALQVGQRVAEAFLSRPAWSVSNVRTTASRLPVPHAWPELVFCEDTSRFITLDDAREVETDVPGPHTRRFIEQLEDVRYDPLRRVL